MAQKNILTIVYKLLKEGNADKEVLRGLKSLQQGVGMAMGAFGALAGVGYTLNKVYQNTTQVFMDYAMKVKEAQRLTGENAEQTSRLIQVADDAAISYESLQKALWFASKSGVEVNLESIARLSDEYVALAGPIEKAEFLAKNFGKGGAEMGKLLEKGGDGVRAMTDAIGDNLILSDAQVQQAEELRLSIDELKDSFEGLKIAAGSEFAPGITKGLSTVNAYIASNSTEVEKNQNKWSKWGGVLFAGIPAIESWIDITNAKNQVEEEGRSVLGQLILETHRYANGIEHTTVNIDSATLSYMRMGEAGFTQAGALAESTMEMQEAALAAEEMSRSNTDMLSLVMNLQSENDRYSENLGELKTKMADLRTEQGLYTAGSDDYIKLQGEIDKTGEAITDLAAEHEMAGKRIAFSLIQQKMAVDGLSDAEFSALLEIGNSWGIIDEQTMIAAHNMNSEANALANGGLKNVRSRMKEIIDRAETLKELSGSSFDFFVNIHTSGSFDPKLVAYGLRNRREPIVGVQQIYAEGGQLGNGWAMVGEAGMEIISPDGYVFPHDATKHLLASGLVPQNGFATGGQMQWSEPPDPVTQTSSKSLSRARSSPRIGSSRSGSGGVSAPQSQASATAVVTEAVQPLAESTSQAVHNAQVTQQVTVTALQGLTTAQSETNNLMAGIRDDLKRNNATIQASMIAAVEQMRG